MTNTNAPRGVARLLGLAALAVISLVAVMAAVPAEAAGPKRGTVVVANRNSSDLTLIDVRTDAATTVPLPAGANPAEPMYVVFASSKVFVGDRANDRVLVYNPVTWRLLDEVPTGAGVFHMWADPLGRQLWVNNDVDNTITVIDTRTLEVIDTVDLPADLVAAGGKPHDVILDRRSAYVTMLGLPGDSDVVIRYRLRDFAEVARAEVGNDPHVTIDPARGSLFVASQGSSEIAVLHRFNLSRQDTVSIPAAHGLDITQNGRVVYTTNIGGGGTDALWAVNVNQGEVIGEPVDTPVAVPHNLVLADNDRKLYVTHSGPNTAVSVYTVSRQDPVPVYLTTVDVGLNPFGLEYVPGR